MREQVAALRTDATRTPQTGRRPGPGNWKCWYCGSQNHRGGWRDCPSRKRESPTWRPRAQAEQRTSRKDFSVKPHRPSLQGGGNRGQYLQTEPKTQCVQGLRRNPFVRACADGGQEVSMLLDTGVDISLISSEHISEHQKQHIQPTSQSNPRAAPGNVVKMEGVLRMTVRMGRPKGHCHQPPVSRSNRPGGAHDRRCVLLESARKVNLGLAKQHANHAGTPPETGNSISQLPSSGPSTPANRSV